MHGPLAEDVFFRARYVIVYVDERSRLRYVVVVKDLSSDAQSTAFKWYRAWFHYWTGQLVCGFMSDGGGAYVSNENRDFCDDSAILQMTTVAHNHQGNSLPESLWSLAFPRVRAMLLDMFGDTHQREAVVIRFWALALVLHVNYVLNRMPSDHLEGKSPLEFATGEQQTFRWLRTFGDGITALVPPEKRGNKTTNFMQPVGRPGVWCGVAEHQKGIVAYMLDTGQCEAVADYRMTGQKSLHVLTPLPPPLTRQPAHEGGPALLLHIPAFWTSRLQLAVVGL